MPCSCRCLQSDLADDNANAIADVDSLCSYVQGNRCGRRTFINQTCFFISKIAYRSLTYCFKLSLQKAVLGRTWTVEDKMVKQQCTAAEKRAPARVRASILWLRALFLQPTRSGAFACRRARKRADACLWLGLKGAG